MTAQRAARLGVAAGTAVLVVSAALSVRAAPLQGGGGQIESLLRRNGIQPITPPSSAVDFTLPNLSGTEVRLSETSGRWVLLTFFATWCGPCASEMPALEALHQARSGAGLQILGVASEAGRDKVAAFTSKKGVTFEVLVDGSAQVAATYQASSIPVAYLIAPGGHVVGVARGARNWSGMTALFDDLLALIPPDPDATSSYAAAGPSPNSPGGAAGAPVQLPSTLVPPDAEVQLASPTGPTAGETFALAVHVTWAGTFEDYVLLPPEVKLPEGVELVRTSASTSSKAGFSVITYTIDLRAPQPGKFALDPVELRYTPRHEPQPVARRIGGPTVEVLEPTIAGVTPRTLFITGGGAALLVAAGTVAAGLRRRRGAKRVQAAQTQDRHVTLNTILEAARHSRVRGDVAACLEAIQTLEAQLAGDGGEADPGLATLIERARYGGQAPPAQDLDQLLRRTERRLAELAPPSDKQADKPEIKLRS